MMDRCGKILAIAALLSCLGIWPVWSTPPKNDEPPFCVHMTSTQSYFRQDGTASTVIHTVVWEKSPDKSFFENENRMKVSNGETGWSYNKKDRTYRTERRITISPGAYTADYRISCARQFYDQVKVKEPRRREDKPNDRGYFLPDP